MMAQLRSERVGKNRENTSMEFLYLLEDLRNFKSTIASDKIYGIIGLTDRKDQFVVDYNKKSEEVFTDLAVSELQTGSLDILSHCVEVPGKQRSLAHLPSWVPDWTCSGWVEPFRVRGLKANACGNSSAKFTIDVKSGTLYIKGKIMDKISKVEMKKSIPRTPGVSSPHQKNDPSRLWDSKHWNKEWVVLQREADKAVCQNILDMAFPEKICTPQTWENLWRTFMCNRTRENDVPSDDCASGFDVHLKLVIQDGGGPLQVLQELTQHQISQHGLSSEEAEDFYVSRKMAWETLQGANSKWCYHRRFFRSEEGRFGWIADGGQPGDVIAMFYGGDYPFVLRPGQDGEYRILGDCYLHGMMEGEALNDTNISETEFKIV